MRLPGFAPGWTASVSARAGLALGRFFPPALFRPGLPPLNGREIRIDHLPPSIGEIDEISEAVASGRAVNLVLAQGLFLRKTLRLSRGAGREAAAAIATELRQTLPARGEGLVWREMRVRRDRNASEHAVFILKRSDLDGLLRAVGEAARVVTIADAPGVAPIFDARAGHDRPRRFWRIATPAAAAALTALALIGQWQQISALRQERARLTDRVAALQDRAVTARELAEAQNGDLAALVKDVALFERERQRLPILAGLAETLGAGVAVSSLIIDRDVARLTGQTRREVPQVMESLAATAWAGSPRLDGPIVVDPVTGERRFQLVVDLRPIEATP